MKKTAVFLGLLSMMSCGSDPKSKGVEPQADVEQLFSLPDDAIVKSESILGVWFNGSGESSNRVELRIAITEKQVIVAKSCFNGGGEKDLTGKVVLAVDSTLNEVTKSLNLVGGAQDTVDGCSFTLNSGKATFEVKADGRLLEIVLPGSNGKIVLKRISEEVPASKKQAE